VDGFLLQVAIKKLNVLSMSEKELYEFRHEVALMKYALASPLPLHFFGVTILTNSTRAMPDLCATTRTWWTLSVRSLVRSRFRSFVYDRT
jgi:hypothetical protein